MSSAELLLHPVRLRIVQAFLGDRRLTTADVAANLDDIAPATLYRHVATLAAAGVLVTDSEQRVRGTSERTYRLSVADASVRVDDLDGLDVEEHRRMFTTFVAMLLRDYDRYLATRPTSLLIDGVGYRQAALWLDDTELAAVAAELGEVVARWSTLPAEDHRTRRLLATILMPDPAGTSGTVSTSQTNGAPTVPV